MSNSEQLSRSPGGEGELHKRNPPLVIRPDRRSYQWPRGTLAPVRFHWRNVLKLGANVLGVFILVSVVILIVMQVGASFAGSRPQSDCFGHQLCTVNGTSRAGSANSGPLASQSVTAPARFPSVPAAAGTANRTPGSAQSTPVAMQTPPYAVLKVMPAAIAIDHYSSCSNHKVALIIQLRDVGGQPLIWRQGAKTSPGLSMSVSGNGYLIEPGQTVKVKLSCSRVDVKGQYHVEIAYNGGSMNIPVQVKNSR